MCPALFFARIIEKTAKQCYHIHMEVITLFPHDYYGKFDEIKESYTDKDGLLHVELESKTEEIKCRHCGGIAFHFGQDFAAYRLENAVADCARMLSRYADGSDTALTYGSADGCYGFAHFIHLILS